MSIKLMAQVWERVFSRAQQIVMLALADHARDDGSHVYPSLPLVARKTSYSLRQVKRIIGELRRRGVLAVVTAARRGRPTEYKINLAVVPEKPPFSKSRPTSDTESPQSEQNVVTPPTLVVTSTADCGDNCGPIEPLEASRNLRHHSRSLAKDSDFNSTEVAQILAQQNGWSGKELIWALAAAIDFQSKQMPNKKLRDVGELLLITYREHCQSQGRYAVGPQKFFAEGRYLTPAFSKPNLATGSAVENTIALLEGRGR